MITGINGSSEIMVTGGNANLPYVSPPSGMVSAQTVDGRPCYAGDVRYMNGGYQIFNNGYWTSSSQHTKIELMPDVVEVLKWAKNKMNNEKEIEKLAEQYPAVKTAKEQLDLVLALVKDHK